jgi:hypothetical protein
MITIGDILGRLRDIISGFIKPKDTILPFDGLKLASKFKSQDDKVESSISEENALNKANEFVQRAQQMYNFSGENNDSTR